MATGCPLTALPHPIVLPQAHLCNPHPPYSTTPDSQTTQQPAVERRGCGEDTQLRPLSSMGARKCSAPPSTAATLAGAPHPPCSLLVHFKRIPPTIDTPIESQKTGGLPISDSGSYPQTFKMSLWVPMTSREKEGDPRHK